MIGAGGAAIGLLGTLFPRATDLVMEAAGRRVQVTAQSGRARMRDNLYEGRPGGDERSSLPGKPHRRTSQLLEAQLNPVATLAVLAGIGALALAAMTARRLSRT